MQHGVCMRIMSPAESCHLIIYRPLICASELGFRINGIRASDAKRSERFPVTSEG